MRTRRATPLLSPTWRTILLGPAAGMMLAAAGCGDGFNRQQAAQNESIFGLFSPPKPAEAAAWSQDPYDADKRYRGTNLLANAPFGGEEIYVRMYASKLGAPPATEPDGDPGVRGIAARALSMHGDPAHAKLILPLLAEPNRNVRLEGVRALQRIHNPTSVDPLIRLLSIKNETDADVRAEAATALGQYADRKVIVALIGALDDDSFLVNTAARRSLEVLTGEDFGEDQKRWLSWSGETTDAFAGRKAYLYPAFERDRYWYEYLPFVPPPPNELMSTPIGMRPDGTSDLAARRVPLSPVAGEVPLSKPVSTTTTAQTASTAPALTEPVTPQVDLIANDRVPTAAAAATVSPVAIAPSARTVAVPASAVTPAPAVAPAPVIAPAPVVAPATVVVPAPAPSAAPIVPAPVEVNPFRRGSPVQPKP